MKIGQLEINLGELAEFLVRAKKHCYAGNGEKEILPDGSKRLTFQEGNFHYEDNYDGWYQAPGSEIVRWQRKEGQRIWQMSYSGGMLSEFIGDEKITKRTFNFLKKALLRVTPERPFRGPEKNPFKLGKVGEIWKYHAQTWGSISRFKGEEKIILDSYTPKINRAVFSQDYIGGLVIPR